MKSYTYTIQEVCPLQFMDEVDALLNKKLYANEPGDSVDGYCNFNDTNTIIKFYQNLSEAEENILNNFVSNYVCNPNYLESKHFKINNSSDDPSTLDYDILGFNKKRTIIKGELIEVEYYNNYIPSSNTFSDLVVCEEKQYFRNAYGLATHRNQISHWILNDGTTGLTKSFTKYYTQTESIQEGINRRTNIIDEAKVCVLNNIGQMYGFDFLTGVKSHIELYKDGYRPPLIDAVSASTKAYMGTKQVNGLTATTIVDANVSQIDSLKINNVLFSYASTNNPTKSEIAIGIVSLITGTTATTVSNYVTASVVDDVNGAIKIESKIPGWPFVLSDISSNLSSSVITANNNTLKQTIVDILTF